MLEKIEFFNCPDGSISAKPSDGDMVVFDMTCRHIANIKARLNMNHTHQIIAYCNGKDY